MLYQHTPADLLASWLVLIIMVQDLIVANPTITEEILSDKIITLRVEDQITIVRTLRLRWHPKDITTKVQAIIVNRMTQSIQVVQVEAQANLGAIRQIQAAKIAPLTVPTMEIDRIDKTTMTPTAPHMACQ